MKNQTLTCITVFCSITCLCAQQTDSIPGELSEVVITAFEQNRKLVDVPAAVSSITQKQLLRFNNSSILPAMNTMPGVRMEERSPGSYRLNIRGSSLRSPFGVRNVKVYLNDIPFTEPGGSTYLNLLSFFNIQSIEVVKGPGSSLYGAGSGGAVLLHSSQNNQPAGAGIDYSFGSFGLQNINVYARTNEEKAEQCIGFTKLHSNGYRSWTKLDRTVFTWDGRFNINGRQSIRTYVLYADLAYQTPGGLTATEFAANPRQARPKAGSTPSSEQAKAGINQKSYLTGLSHTFSITDRLKNITSIYGAFSQFANPTVRNFERRSEPHTGARTIFSFTPEIKNARLKIVAGAEMQRGWYNIRQYKNKNGISDSLQTEDEVNPFLWTLFAQADMQLLQNWNISFGLSSNHNTIAITRLTQLPLKELKRTYQNEIAPRIAVLKKITNSISVYASAAKGFSPPTSAEVLPSTGVISTELNAEEGWNYEIGSRMNLLKGKLFVDANAFFFNLKNTIVQRRDATGADYFINAGSTKQHGFEGMVHYKITSNQNHFIAQSRVWLGYTYNNFRYNDFKQYARINNKDTVISYNNNQLPGVPASVVTAGIDAATKQGIYINITYNYNEKVALNDANSFYGADFHLLSARIGYRNVFFKKLQGEIFVGGDNLFNETYSLGNDVNAAFNRFYNVAPGRNYTAGVSLFLTCKKQ
jgi:iron complex outermembrane receptor protein